MARVVVCGYMLRHPVPGNVLAFFQYVLGLHLLGHDVLYVEESGWPGSAYDPATGTSADDPWGGLACARALFAEHALDAPVVYVNRDSGVTDGMTRAELGDAIADADLLLDIGGVCWLPEFARCRARALIDMDPLFTQVGRFGADTLAHHDTHFSYGTRIGRAGCGVPTAGVRWMPTVPPVVPSLWSDEAGAVASRAVFTTIANWSAYGAVTHGGERYGQKDEEFVKLLDLPSRTSERLELALSGADGDTRALLAWAGWSTADAGALGTDMRAYREYVMGSRGEFSAAKNAYVKSRSGWFSDRTVCYLAAGRPAVVQDTGFSAWLPCGEGVLAFSTVDEAAAALDAVGRDYDAHRAAARAIAGRYFAHDVVLPALLERALRQTPAEEAA